MISCAELLGGNYLQHVFDDRAYTWLEHLSALCELVKVSHFYYTKCGLHDHHKAQPVLFGGGTYDIERSLEEISAWFKVTGGDFDLWRFYGAWIWDILLASIVNIWCELSIENVLGCLLAIFRFC